MYTSSKTSCLFNFFQCETKTLKLYNKILTKHCSELFEMKLIVIEEWDKTVNKASVIVSTLAIGNASRWNCY